MRRRQRSVEKRHSVTRDVYTLQILLKGSRDPSMRSQIHPSLL